MSQASISPSRKRHLDESSASTSPEPFKRRKSSRDNLTEGPSIAENPSANVHLHAAIDTVADCKAWSKSAEPAESSEDTSSSSDVSSGTRADDSCSTISDSLGSSSIGSDSDSDSQIEDGSSEANSDSDSSSSSDSSDSDSEPPSTPPIINLPLLGKPQIATSSPPKSHLLSRISDFLPQLAAANAELDEDRAAGRLEDRNIENVDGEDGDAHIEMVGSVFICKFLSS